MADCEYPLALPSGILLLPQQSAVLSMALDTLLSDPETSSHIGCTIASAVLSKIPRPGHRNRVRTSEVGPSMLIFLRLPDDFKVQLLLKCRF